MTNNRREPAVRLTKKRIETLRKWAKTGRVVFFDTETTGLGECDQICQIAAVEYVAGQPTREFMCYAVPTCPLDPEAAAINGLSMKFLRKKGVAPEKMLTDFFAFLGTDVLLVAHNLPFDERLLRQECGIFDFPYANEGVETGDTLALARCLKPGLESYRLCRLIEAFGLAGKNSHDALDDTRACASLFYYLTK